tara:strand:+ start:264 stop:725 length:462 start_codon:yes stop_codon:yes gene_type:complete
MLQQGYTLSVINKDHLAQCLHIEQTAEKSRSIRTEDELRNLLHCYTCYGLFNSNDELVCYAVFSIVLDEAELIDINLLKTQQNKGLGTDFLKACLHELAKQQVIEIILEVAVDNPQAIKSYQKFKYTELGVRKNYYQNADGTRSDALIYKIEL